MILKIIKVCWGYFYWDKVIWCTISIFKKGCVLFVECIELPSLKVRKHGFKWWFYRFLSILPWVDFLWNFLMYQVQIVFYSLWYFANSVEYVKEILNKHNADFEYNYPLLFLAFLYIVYVFEIILLNNTFTINSFTYVFIK